MNKRFISLLLVFVLLLSMTGCGNKRPEDGEYQIYYLNMDITKIVPEAYDSTGATGEQMVRELLDRLAKMPDSSQLRQTIPSNVTINDVKVNGEYLTIDFCDTYLQLSVTEEVLIRAAIVRTLLQVEGFSLVAFTINSVPLRSKDGALVGNMSTDTFVENPGEQINAVMETSIKLYFSSKDGKSLVEEVRDVQYSTSMSLEKLVMEQLIDGPKDSKMLATIPSGTRIINMTTVDGVCYVNVDNTFMTQNQEIKEEIVLYSIVNSLTQIQGVNKVQLSVNGDTKGFCRYTYPLSTMYEKDMNLMQSTEVEGE